MASYKTYIPTTPNEYIPQLSVEDFKQGLQIKQQQYDFGRQNVQSSIDNMFGLEVLRDVDRQYLSAKQDEVIGQINQYSHLDLSDPNSTYQLSNQISPLYRDKNILTAVESSAKIKNLYSNIETLKQKHPDKYSPLNEEYDMSHVKAYSENQEIGKPYNGPMTPTLYFDYKKEAIEAAKTIKPTTYTDPSTGERVTGIDPRQISMGLSQGAKQQIQLEFEMSGAKIVDPIQAKNVIATDIMELDKMYANVPKDSPYYSDYLQQREQYSQILKNQDEDYLLQSVNAMQLNEIITNLAKSVSYNQRTISPEALQKLKYDQMALLQSARIASNEKMNTERVEAQKAVAGMKSNGTHSAITEVLSKLDKRAEENPAYPALDGRDLKESIQIKPGLSGKPRYIHKIELNEDGTYNLYIVDKDFDETTGVARIITQPGGKDHILQENVSRQQLEDMFNSYNKPIKNPLVDQTKPEGEDDSLIDLEKELEL